MSKKNYKDPKENEFIPKKEKPKLTFKDMLELSGKTEIFLPGNLRLYKNPQGGWNLEGLHSGWVKQNVDVNEVVYLFKILEVIDKIRLKKDNDFIPE